MLFNELYLLYEKNKDVVGKINDDNTILLPIAHNRKKADVEIVIDADGNFLRAKCADDEKNIISVTEESAGRTQSPESHPLCDEIQYLAGDYEKYVKTSLSAFDKYYKLLKSWNDSKYSHEKVSAVFKYISKKTLLNDIINKAKLLETDKNDKIKLSEDKNGKQTNKTKLNGKDIEIKKIFIRFVIEPSIENKPCETWKDSTLYDRWIEFYLAKKSNNEKKDLCYISGNNMVISENHPKVIGNAKLISANDKSGFTYRGRFSISEEALSVSYEISQKAHNALKWLIDRQRLKIDSSFLLVAWETNMLKIPSIVEDTFNLFDSVSEPYPQTQKEFADKLTKAILGYKSNLDLSSKTLVLILDAATSGRLSVKMFRNLDTSLLINNIAHWHKTCNWNFTNYKDKEAKISKIYYYAPSLKNIANYIYGTEKNGFMNADADIVKKTIERLIPCVIDKKIIPIDMVKTAIWKVSNPMAFSRYNWEKLLEITSSVIKKYKNDLFNKNNKKDYREVWTMALDENLKDRSYLYGRLLAVADRIEYRTYESNENRETNAKRYMSSFSQRPYKIWQIIYKNLTPYLNKLNKGEKIFYQNMLQDIHELFDTKDFMNNSALDGSYILGFECQSKQFRYKKEEEK